MLILIVIISILFFIFLPILYEFMFLKSSWIFEKSLWYLNLRTFIYFFQLNYLYHLPYDRISLLFKLVHWNDSIILPIITIIQQSRISAFIFWIKSNNFFLDWKIFYFISILFLFILNLLFFLFLSDFQFNYSELYLSIFLKYFNVFKLFSRSFSIINIFVLHIVFTVWFFRILIHRCVLFNIFESIRL